MSYQGHPLGTLYTAQLCGLGSFHTRAPHCSHFRTPLFSGTTDWSRFQRPLSALGGGLWVCIPRRRCVMCAQTSNKTIYGSYLKYEQLIHTKNRVGRRFSDTNDSEGGHDECWLPQPRHFQVATDRWGSSQCSVTRQEQRTASHRRRRSPWCAVRKARWWSDCAPLSREQEHRAPQMHWISFI